jgi:uncharacterized protein YqeY
MSELSQQITEDMKTAMREKSKKQLLCWLIAEMMTQVAGIYEDMS